MKRYIILLFLTLTMVSGCSKEELSGKLKVSTSTYPMYYIANEIGKENIELNSLIPIGVDPHEYEISLNQTKQLETTDILLYNGSGLEHWGEKVSENIESKDKKVINASDYVELLDIDEEDNHDHSVKDPHIWLNPNNVDKIAKKLTQELQIIDPENSEQYEKNYLELSKQLKDLDNKYIETLKDRKDDTILVSHMAFAYLADRYDLEQISVTGISPHSEPSPKSISKLIDLTKEKNIKHIFFEVLSSPKSVEMIAQEANLEILKLNPIGGITQEQFDTGLDYIDLMEENLDNLKKALVD